LCVIRDFGKSITVQALNVLGTYVEIVGYTFVYLKTQNMSYQILLLSSYVATIDVVCIATFLDTQKCTHPTVGTNNMYLNPG
jgi:hypothetical protein